MSDVLPFGTNACFVIKGCSLQVKLQFGRLFTASIFWAFFSKAIQEKKKEKLLIEFYYYVY